MTYLSGTMQGRLQQAFADNNMTLDIRTNSIVIENSSACLKERIQEIVESVSFCPFISDNKIEGNFVFTITPYELPDSFKQTSFINPLALPHYVQTSLSLKNTEKETNLYFTKNEIAKLLEEYIFTKTQKNKIKDKLHIVNAFRNFVSTSLTKGLDEILLNYAKQDLPIIEIGSRIGYTLSENLSKKIIRTQTNTDECHLLSPSISENIYQRDIKELFNCLNKAEKKVSLFFALHTFDSLSPSLRQESFAQIFQLQNTDDHLVIMMDSNPQLSETLQHIKCLYPEYAIFPYYPLTGVAAKFSIILMPLEFTSHQLSHSELVDMIHKEAEVSANGLVSEFQFKLHQFQQKFDLKVIALEDFFVEQAKSELERVGYKTNVYYHTSFTTGKLKEGLMGIKQDVIYKSVTDTGAIRQWCLTDEKFSYNLAQKCIIPPQCNEKFLYSLREKGHKIFGAEILVIDAKKV